MNTWKLSIKPDSQKGLNPLTKCREKSLLGLGWHHAYSSRHPSDLTEAKKLVIEKWKEWPYQLKYLLEDMKAGDHVWIHQNGKYFLCKVEDESILYGSEIDSDYSDYDLGHARKAVWVVVPDKFVTGTIQRGTIAQRTIQKIELTKREVEFNQLLFDKLNKNSAWEPNIDTGMLTESLSGISSSELFSLMSPDDVEDVISAYMQGRGWMLIKSTCFRSKPKFEFSMLNKKGEIAHIQVKSGKHTNSLKPESYESYAGHKNLIFLFSTNKTSYPGKSASGVYTIKHDEIHKWVKNNLWAITLPLKSRLWLFLNESKY